ncbi:hypothetical protein PO124_17935 [Bacillus licheniformis]|nr:hypothetical protein [Bacillus licheniformis]
MTCTAKPECLQRRLYTSTKSRILYEMIIGSKDSSGLTLTMRNSRLYRLSAMENSPVKR